VHGRVQTIAALRDGIAKQVCSLKFTGVTQNLGQL
jgi:hypothetical protein